MNPTAQSEVRPAALRDLVFGRGDAGAFALVDGAAAPKLVKSLFEVRPQYCCLYPGELPPDLALVAPYLVQLDPERPFAALLMEAWGSHWGLFVSSASDLRTLRDHFRQFHKVELPDQRTVIFRYYDPRVLRIFLPVCNPLELAQFFGPVQSFLLEGETPDSASRFLFAGQALKSEPFSLKPAK